jgi:N6-adenosine-specific RNA methylase IME4
MKDRMGIGQYFRGITEDCLFGVRGNLPYLNKNGKRAQGITGFTAPRTEHSAKPVEMRAMIEHVSGSEDRKMLEMFAREPHEGWHCIGNEINGNSILDEILQLTSHETLPGNIGDHHSQLPTGIRSGEEGGGKKETEAQPDIVP